MPEENVIQIGSDLHNVGRATFAEKVGKKVKIDYGYTFKILNHDTQAEADSTMELIDAAITAAEGNDDIWYSWQDQRYHLGAVTSIQKVSRGNFGSSNHELWFYFDNTIRKIDFGSDQSARDTEYTDIKTEVEAATDAALWVENDSADKLINFDNVAVLNRVDDTTIRIEHAGGGVDNVIQYADKATLDADITSWGGDVADASVAISVDVPLTEAQLNGAVITVSLVNDTFDDDTLDTGNFTLNNAPTGTTVDSVEYVDEDTANVTLAFDGTNFDTDVTNFSITVDAAELTGTSNLTSNTLTIGATTATLSVDPALTETNLNGSVVTVTLANDKYTSGVAAGDLSLNNAPTGCTIDSISRVSDTVVDVTLDFDGTDFDVDVTDFSVTVDADGVEGDWDITSDEITITAVVE